MWLRHSNYFVRNPFAFATAFIMLSLTACGGGGGSSPPPPPLPNQAPLANAGADQTVVEGNVVSLSAATSSDSDGTIASYAWNQTSGPAVTLQNSATVTATFDSPLTDSPLALAFEVSVTDDDGASASATTNVTIDPSQPPVVNSGADIQTVERDTVTLDATVTDTDGSVSSYAWTQISGPGVTLSGADTEDAQFDAPIVATLTDLGFQLTAVDNTNDQSSDTVVVTVNPNEPPEFAVRFPCAGCRAYGSAIAVAGSATSGQDNPFVSGIDGIGNVIVDAGAGAISAIVAQDGNWTAQNVPLPNNSDMVLMSITVEDLFGEMTNDIVNLEHEPTLTSVLVAHDPVSPDFVYFFESSSSFERLFAVDLTARSFTMLHESGTPNTLGDVAAVIADSDGSQLFVSRFSGGIVTFDTSTGAMSNFSDAAKGNGPVIADARMMTLDSNSGRLLVFDNTNQALLVVDTVTGDRNIVSDNVSVGSGPPFVAPSAIAVDSAGDNVYVSEPTDVYLSINIATGARSLLPNPGGPVGPVWSLGFDALRSQLVALTPFDDVFSVDVASGSRSLVSSGTVTGLPTGNAGQLTVDVLSDRYVVNDYSGNAAGPDTNRMLSVAPDSGDRAVLFQDAIGSGESINSHAALDIDAANNYVYLASETDAAIIRLDLTTGVRQVISNSSVGTGIGFGTIRGIALDATNNRILAVDASNAAVVAADLTTGNRSIISNVVVGGGPLLSTPVAIELDAANDQVYIVDQGMAAILSVDLASGQRSVVSDNGNTGSMLTETNGVMLDSANNRLLITELGDGSTVRTELLAVDLASGDRTIISGISVGTGPFLNNIQDVVMLDTPATSIVSGLSDIYRIDLATGNRQIIASRTVANGESINNTASLAYDSSSSVVYTWSAEFEALLAIDTVTGDRVVVSK